MQGRELAAEMAQLREQCAASAAQLAALQKEREEERKHLDETRRALAEALDHLDSTDGAAQACTELKRTDAPTAIV